MVGPPPASRPRPIGRGSLALGTAPAGTPKYLEDINMNLSYETAYANLKMIDQYIAADFDALGITQQDFELFSGSQPWKRDVITRVMRTANALLFGTLEVMGMPKIVVPSEYVAAIVATFVHPANRMIACIWLAQERQTGVGALELSARAQTTSQLDPTSAEQLFALVQLLSDSDESNEARKRFRAKVGLAVEKSLNIADRKN